VSEHDPPARAEAAAPRIEISCEPRRKAAFLSPAAGCDQPLDRSGGALSARGEWTLEI